MPQQPRAELRSRGAGELAEDQGNSTRGVLAAPVAAAAAPDVRRQGARGQVRLRAKHLVRVGPRVGFAVSGLRSSRRVPGGVVRGREVGAPRERRSPLDAGDGAAERRPGHVRPHPERRLGVAARLFCDLRHRRRRDRRQGLPPPGLEAQRLQALVPRPKNKGRRFLLFRDRRPLLRRRPRLDRADPRRRSHEGLPRLPRGRRLSGLGPRLRHAGPLLPSLRHRPHPPGRRQQATNTTLRHRPTPQPRPRRRPCHDRPQVHGLPYRRLRRRRKQRRRQPPYFPQQGRHRRRRHPPGILRPPSRPHPTSPLTCSFLTYSLVFLLV
mmetsp:Transcript_20854/g.67176  ORF Transcript_20854/g.67176 Transcript_20854/m.67176 type:complete len:324 (+) Transcript_20854:127-1098(+)